MAINESLDAISKSLKNILGDLGTAETKVKAVKSSTDTLTKAFGNADSAVQKLIKSLERAVEVQTKLETGAGRVASAYARAGGPTVSATMSTQSGVPSQGAGGNLMPNSLAPVPSIGAGQGLPLAAMAGVRAPSVAGVPAMGGTAPIAGAPGFVGSELALLGLAGLNNQPGSLGGGAGGSRALGLAKITGRAALTSAVAGLQFAYNATPGYRDAMSFQNALFSTAFAGATYDNPYNEGRVKQQVRASFGSLMSSNTDALGAAALLTSRGLGPNNAAFQTVMGESAAAFALSGMSNPAAASGLANLQGGSTSGRLAQYGIFTNSLQDGSYKGMGNVIDQMWARWFGSQSKKVPIEVFEAQLLGGWIGADLRVLFGDSPELYQQIVDGLRLKAKAGGQAGIDFSSQKGPNSFMTIAKKTGMSEENLPRLTEGRMSESRYGAISATEDALLDGMRASADLIVEFNKGVEATADALELFYKGKGVYQSFMDSSEGLAAASAAATVLAAAIQATADALNLVAGNGAPPVVATGGGGGAWKKILGRVGAGVGGLAATLALQPGVNAFGKDADEAGTFGGGALGMGKDFMNIMGRAGIGALGGLAVGGPWGALIGAIAEGAYGIQQGITNPNFNVKGAEGDETLIQMALGKVLGMFFSKGSTGAVMGAGASTSDNIHALLSPGEYVVNARAVQAVGVDALNTINSMGQAFGSAYASPARNFSSGGATTGGFPVLGPNDPRIKTYNVGSRSIKLSSEYADIILPAIRAYAADPVLAPVTYLSGYEHRRMYNPATGTYTGNWSFHAAGVAYDIDADYWGMPGSARVPSPSEEKAIRKILSANPRMKWGGDWTGNSRDPHHWEVRSNGSSGPAYEGYGQDAAKSPENQPKVSESQAPMIIEASTDLLRPMASNSGGEGYFMNGVSITPLGSAGKGVSAAFSLTDPLGSLGGGNVMLDMLGSLTGSGTARASSNGSDESSENGESDPVSDTGSSPTGSGAKWLYNFLVSKGLRGDNLRVLWTIGMRESGANPALISAMSRGKFNWPKKPPEVTFNPEVEHGFNGGRYDVGVFQINSQHVGKVKSQFGGNMLKMVDPNNNFEMMKSLSGGFGNWRPWGITGVNGGNLSYIDWSTWGPTWAGPGGYGAKTQQNDRAYWQSFPKYNTNGYSQGAWRTTNETARLHEGEMVLPAEVAEDFRGALREMMSGRGGSSQPVTIHLHIAQASDAEAMRFAKKVKNILDGDKTLDSLRSR